VTIFVRNTSIDDIVKLLLATNQLERKLLNANSVLIYPATPAKTREYVELVTRSFYLANADVKQAQAMVRALVKTRDVFADEKLNLLVIKDTPEAVQLAERLLESLDMAEPEVMLDVEVLEVTRSKLLELGLQFPDQIGYGLLQPSTSSTIINNGVTQTNTNLGGTLAPGFVDLRNRAGLTSFVTNPALLLNLKNQDGDGNLLANPRIRVKNREKAKIHIGEKLPVFTTTSTANVGVSASVAYLDVGLKLEVEPNVFLDDDVSIKVGLEVSSIVKEVPGPSSSLAYQVGTRSVATTLRLRNGETQVLAGLISDEERSSASRLPGLGDVPLLGRLFSSQRNNNSKTEIVLLITPRIVRNLNRPVAGSVSVPAGSEASVGAPALVLSPSGLRSLGLSSTSGGLPPRQGSVSPVLPGVLPPQGARPPLPAPVAPAEGDAAQSGIQPQEQAAPANAGAPAAGRAGAPAPAATAGSAAAPPANPLAPTPIDIPAPSITSPGTAP
jgi:general secretion pathway protein D